MSQRRRKRILADVHALRFELRLLRFRRFLEEATGELAMPWQMEIAACILRARGPRMVLNFPRRTGYYAARTTAELARHYLRNVLESRPND